MGPKFWKSCIQNGLHESGWEKAPLSLVLYRAFYFPHVPELEQYSDALLHNIFQLTYHIRIKDSLVLKSPQSFCNNSSFSILRSFLFTITEMVNDFEGGECKCKWKNLRPHYVLCKYKHHSKDMYVRCALPYSLNEIWFIVTALTYNTS